MPTALVITAPGINCDEELVHAFRTAGADVESIHLKRLQAEPDLIDRFDLIGLPGGFSYGDDIAAGRIMAALIRQSIYPKLVEAVRDRNVAMIAPCNGFQIAVQAGLLPGPGIGEPWSATPARPVTALSQNQSARFIDRWVRVDIPRETRCIWTQGIEASNALRVLPIAHGEGRFVASAEVISDLARSGQIAVRYAADDNPNGSMDAIAGICDATGLIFGLMPHPERFTRWTQLPWWTRLTEEEVSGEPLGLCMFRNAVRHASRVAVTA